MFKIKEPLMQYDVVAIMKMTSGYQVAITGVDSGPTINIALVTEDEVMEVIKSVLSGEYLVSTEEEVSPTDLIH